MDDYELDWEFAQDICYRTFAYTNHTVMQEALERCRRTGSGCSCRAST